ncbi:hypothetical protein AA101099_1061 [Neoasaia chiangmaiensis NBRC 101099]|uniref:Uncharacterized protein n=1 Tax=Neoasaia chiangmaiensis TaxID=320497 RepID=A0A1U9KMW8_9PROT|nr:DUF4169 family protein [Neoasaia chiangmaiensis]AQS87136.1 hypothetical protein A0U93_03400 [Neoasaia chiangmaiensis]GBR38143.1 hypothetical protein AA101099_1061 [Neoasaia chiangmaiensis NBRC 101099]GEN16023.1 hypothetical protein NCH01_24540 [Neoasaia chiangmaiensis]
MGEIVNLRRERKRAIRRMDAAQAQTNRALSGRTKAERLRDEAAAERVASRLEMTRLNPEREKE